MLEEQVDTKQTVGVEQNRAKLDIAIPPLFINDRLDFCLSTMVVDPMAAKGPDGTSRDDYVMLFGILEEHSYEVEEGRNR
jgi:hypothetical protein